MYSSAPDSVDAITRWIWAIWQLGPAGGVVQPEGVTPAGAGAFARSNAIGITWSPSCSWRLTAAVTPNVQSWRGCQLSVPESVSATLLEPNLAFSELERS